MKEIYQHTRVEVGAKRPFVITTCTLQEGDTTLAIGVAICSFRDQFNRKVGNTIARGRAMKALTEKRDSCPVRDELRKIVPYSFKSIS